jgi:hypothetical protein
MNIAFTSVLLFIILAPGYLFRTSYKSSELSIKDSNRNIVNDLTWSILPSIIIQTFFIFIVEFFSSYRIDFNQLGNLLLGNSSTATNDTFSKVRLFFYPIFIYNICIFSVSISLGYVTRECIVRKFNLDRKCRVLRFSNKWHYIFTGECLDFPEVPGTFEEITEKYVNVLCRINNKNILYSGEIFNYYIDDKGDLEAIHLKLPERRYLEDLSLIHI